MVADIDVRGARRLALARAGLLHPEVTGLPRRAQRRARAAAHAVVERFGYLQLDTVSVSGARSHALVLMSRLQGFDPAVAEDLLRPGEPLFEYWGHEASWMPLSLYPAFAFRRKAMRDRKWVRRVHGASPGVADELLARLQDGPLRSSDLDGKGSGSWWGWKPSKKVLAALWSTGEVAVSERRSFQRTFDLTERVIPAEHRWDLPADAAHRQLMRLALSGHGWAEERTLRDTWRLPASGGSRQALRELAEEGVVLPCRLRDPLGGDRDGWIRAEDLELVDPLRRARAPQRPVLLSPFDPLLWDRPRVLRLFGFEALLEIFKPAPQRRWGYFCLPVLAGEALVARVDLKREGERLTVKAYHPEPGRPEARVRAWTEQALARQAAMLSLEPGPLPG